jgi:GNAT superfamily N-acetyltransferase
MDYQETNSSMNTIIKIDSRNIELFQNVLMGKSGSNVIVQMITDHLISLSPEDRNLRFFTKLSDEAIQAYVAKIDFKKDGVFVSFDIQYKRITGFLHAPKINETDFEIGVSVLKETRGTGLGYKLFKFAVDWIQTLGGKKIYISCLTKNKAIQKIAGKLGVETSLVDYETREGVMNINPNTNLFLYLLNSTVNNLSVYELAVRKQIYSNMVIPNVSF